MSRAGAHIRSRGELDTAVAEAWRQCRAARALRRRRAEPDETGRSACATAQLCFAHAVYLEAVRFAVDSGVGSRGSAIVLDAARRADPRQARRALAHRPGGPRPSASRSRRRSSPPTAGSATAGSPAARSPSPTPGSRRPGHGFAAGRFTRGSEGIYTDTRYAGCHVPRLRGRAKCIRLSEQLEGIGNLVRNATFRAMRVVRSVAGWSIETRCGR